MSCNIFVGACLGVPGLASAYWGICWDAVSGLLFLARNSLAVGESRLRTRCRAIIRRRRDCLCIRVVRVCRLG